MFSGRLPVSGTYMKYISYLFLLSVLIIFTAGCGKKEPPKKTAPLKPVKQKILDNTLDRAEAVIDEMNPYFSGKPDAPGNGAGYLIKLLSENDFADLAVIPGDSLEETERKRTGTQAFIDSNPAFPEMMSGLTEFESFHFKRDISRGPDMKMPEHAGIRNLYIFLEEYLPGLASRSRFDAFMSALKGAEYFLDTYDEPSLQSHLIRTACRNSLLKGVNSSLVYVSKSEDAQQILSLMPAEELLRKQFKRSLKGELAVFGPLIRNADAEGLQNILQALRLGLKMKIRLGNRIRDEGADYIYLEKKNCFDKMLKLPEVADMPYEKGIEETIGICTISVFDGNILSYPLMPAYEKAYNEQFQVLSGIEVLKAVIAVHQYFLETSTLPKTLKDIPEYGRSGLPKDRYYGKDLVYQRGGNPLYFRIKDIGPDKNDYGQFLKPVKKEGADTYTHAPLGWRVELMEYVFGIDYYTAQK